MRHQVPSAPRAIAPDIDRGDNRSTAINEGGVRAANRIQL